MCIYLSLLIIHILSSGLFFFLSKQLTHTHPNLNNNSKQVNKSS